MNKLDDPELERLGQRWDDAMFQASYAAALRGGSDDRDYREAHREWRQQADYWREAYKARLAELGLL